MKTLELKLKKDLLIVEVDKSFNHFKIYNDEIGFIFIENNIPRKELIKGSYKFLCKGSELTEEIARELVENKTKHKFENKVLTFYNSENLESFISAVESKGFYWLVNPCGKNRPIKNDYNSLIQFNGYLEEWQEAEEKTFRNPLIFVKK